MAAKYLLKNSKNGKFTFSLLAGNGQIVMTASEIYDTKAAALNGIESCKTNGTEDARFERKNSRSMPATPGAADSTSTPGAAISAARSRHRTGVTRASEPI